MLQIYALNTFKTTSSDAFIHTQTSDTSGNIDWNIETNSGGAGDDSIARGTDALTVLDNPVTRNQFVNELLEVRPITWHLFLQISNILI